MDIFSYIFPILRLSLPLNVKKQISWRRIPRRVVYNTFILYKIWIFKSCEEMSKYIKYIKLYKFKFQKSNFLYSPYRQLIVLIVGATYTSSRFIYKCNVTRITRVITLVRRVCLARITQLSLNYSVSVINSARTDSLSCIQRYRTQLKVNKRLKNNNARVQMQSIYGRLTLKLSREIYREWIS